MFGMVILKLYFYAKINQKIFHKGVSEGEGRGLLFVLLLTTPTDKQVNFKTKFVTSHLINNSLFYNFKCSKPF